MDKYTVSEIKRLYDAGYRLTQINAKMSVSWQDIIAALRISGVKQREIDNQIPSRKYVPERAIKEAMKAIENGKSYKHIADKYGVTVDNISHRIKEYRYTQAVREQIKDSDDPRSYWCKRLTICYHGDRCALGNVCKAAKAAAGEF
jgi:hypothetical protein